MASFCRSALMAGSRSIAATRSRTFTTAKSISSPSTRAISNASRVLSSLGSVDSLMPLHSAIANARLKSSIAVDTSCWSWLSQDFAVPR
ncbi:protein NONRESPONDING TO OXYLIPINS 2, mitochondrial isoform X2 [Mercurialis annua]|uniref:protein NONRESPONDING TO OXYLIPINS 2, mitochondrial isoform X2 n=1 Tax=Mercurialis annua TaxID=3986 RepID=UPI00215FD267|nr:protein NONRESPONDING TO OXYLIPINS 2, mitochondrial isoform X2 [Mercurialis annua]